MSERIEVTPALQVVQLVLEHGHPVEDGVEYQGFVVDGEWDAHNLSLSRDNVSLDIRFHNAYQLRSPNDAATQRFVDSIQQLLAGKAVGKLH
ncbi:DUF3081 family protein [uncultured Ferrimonas sp.]|uniref:DUF3081 family protein n=1 Tax=uncultured Ferrimonas sp. TaxID=432640 RepID=UPI002623C282|nr:DUF3081 family protein [uncultured Ferrimonas sp.]